MDIDGTQLFEVIGVQLRRYATRLYERANRALLAATKATVKEELEKSPEYLELTTNSMAYHAFGVPDIEKRLDRVIKAVINGITISVNSEAPPQAFGSGSYFDISIEIKLLDVSHSDILSMGEGIFVTEKGDVLPWLQWLLLEGTEPVILKYHYLNEFRKASRTGFGIMVKNGVWQVPANLSGIQGNNWLTRSMDRLENQLPQILENILRERLEEPFSF